MVRKKISISLSEWIIEEIVNPATINKSGRIEELIIKGHISEKFKKDNENLTHKPSFLNLGFFGFNAEEGNPISIHT